MLLKYNGLPGEEIKILKSEIVNCKAQILFSELETDCCFFIKPTKPKGEDNMKN